MARVSRFFDRGVAREKSDSEIALLITELPDDAEIIATPMMDELVYQLKDYDRGIAICEWAIASGAASPLRLAQLKIAMVNAERRKRAPDMERLEAWMDQSAGILDQMANLDAPGVRRTVVLFHYNGALLCRLDGDFAGEAEHHRETSKITDDAFSRNNAAYMAEVAMMLNHAKEGTTTDEMRDRFLDAGDEYRATLDIGVPREAQWQANDWGHRVQLAILLDHVNDESDDWLDEGFDALTHLLSAGVPPSSGYAADLIIVMTLGEYGCDGMALRLLERIVSDEEAGDTWRMLAAFLKAQITDKDEDYRAVVAMPGNGICHVARAVAERMLTAR